MPKQVETLYGDYSQRVDGFTQRFKYQAYEGKTYVALKQPDEELILQRNAQLRNNPGAVRDLSFGRQVASIPFILWEKAGRDGYQLTSPDAQIAAQEMNRFLSSEDGRKCLIQ